MMIARECRGFAENIFRSATALALALVLVLSLLPCAPACAQSAAEQEVKQLEAGDWVNIQVAGQPDSQSYVGTDGRINVPLVGAVPVGGSSPAQAAERVAKALKDGGFFVDPQVSVVVTQPPGQLISVVGEVASQGRYPITARTTVVELLAQAGGLTEAAADVGYVLHRDEAGHLNRYPVNLDVMAEGADAPPPNLSAGDSLLVPRAEMFSIQGEVASPGRYRVEPGMTVMQALARAGGVTERGSERRIQVKRVIKPGQYKTMSMKASDPVKAGDIIRVKESLF
jgi:polysaccharide export outer membrane protein